MYYSNWTTDILCQHMQILNTKAHYLLTMLITRKTVVDRYQSGDLPKVRLITRPRGLSNLPTIINKICNVYKLTYRLCILYRVSQAVLDLVYFHTVWWQVTEKSLLFSAALNMGSICSIVNGPKIEVSPHSRTVCRLLDHSVRISSIANSRWIARRSKVWFQYFINISG